MKIKLSLRIILFIVFSTPFLFAQNFTMNEGELKTTNVYFEFPMLNVNDELKLNCELGSGSYNFMLDIGAPLCISKSIQREKHFPVILTSPIVDSGNNRDSIDIVRIDTFKFGNIVLTNIPAVVLDFEHSPIACEHIDGLLGSNIIRFFALQFDLTEQKVKLTDNIKTLINKQKPNGKLLLDDQSNAYAINTFNDDVQDTFHFDSGMNGFYDMNSKKVEELLHHLKSKTALLKRAYGSGSQGMFGKEKENMNMMISTDIFFGKHILKTAVIENTDTKSRMGRKLFELGKLTLDYIHQDYYFEADKEIQCYREADFGFKPYMENGKCYAGLVWEGSRAATLGLKAGDEIHKINNIDLKELDNCEKELVLKGAMKKKYLDIDILLNGKLKQINLTKE